MSARPRGTFITFEGLEGTGKSTQVARLARRLRRAGLDVVVTREPGGTRLGRRLRSALLRPGAQAPVPAAELLLYVADRIQHACEVVDPALARGAVVLCDRYIDATVAYQGYGRGLDLALIRRLHALAALDRRPDRTVWIDLDPAAALRRARRRDRTRPAAAREDRFERERLAFHRRVRRGYLCLARTEPRRICRIGGDAAAAVVERRVLRALAALLPAAAAEVGSC
jgi:dTMP kinase